MKKIQSKKKIFNLLIAILICIVSFLPYLHDFEFFKGKKGFSGFSSLRIGIWVVSLFVIAVSGWMFAFVKSKGISYRFVMLVPIFVLMYQLFVYVLDSRKSVINDVNTKVLLHFLLIVLVAIFYFVRKNQSPKNE